jgi:hypothetical protein
MVLSMTHAPATGRSSSHELLVLHSVRVQGLADDAAVAARYRLDPEQTRETLLDQEALGWVSHAEFAGTGGWSMTERGRAADERMLADELDEAGVRGAVVAAHGRFGPLNTRLLQACTDWQLRPDDGDRLAPNDHSDPTWDARVLDGLSALNAELDPLIGDLSGALARFAGYDERFSAALARARAGDGHSVAGTGVDSCHAVWMQLHEDLLSTLGVKRG